MRALGRVNDTKSSIWPLRAQLSSEAGGWKEPVRRSERRDNVAHASSLLVLLHVIAHGASARRYLPVGEVWHTRGVRNAGGRVPMARVVYGKVAIPGDK